MAQRTAVVASKVGLHARPAAIFVKAVGDSGASVKIGKSADALVNGASMLSVMTLGIKHGETVYLESDDEAVLDQLAAMLETDLDQQ